MNNYNTRVIASSVIMILLGLVFFFRPAASMGFFVRVCGIALIVLGGIRIYDHIKGNEMPDGGNILVIGVISLIAGIIFLFSPGFLMTILPLIIGIVLCVDSIKDIRQCINARKSGGYNWEISLALSIIKLVFGIVIIMSPFRSAALFMRIIGIVLVYSGIMNLYKGKMV